MVEHQGRVVTFLRAALRQNRLPHALLFSGSVGSGQIETALMLAKALFCSQQKNGESCNACVDCHQVDQREHPDLLWLELEKDSRVIKVEQVRALISRCSLKPLQASCKVFVIDGADCLNEVAQNALLKTLEEPQGRAYFVLISYAMEKIFSTVRSRAQFLNFIPTSENFALLPDLANARQAVLSYCSAVNLEENASPDLSVLSREETIAVLEAAIEDLREILLIEVGAASVLGPIEERSRKEAAAQRLGRDVLISRLERLADFKEKIAHSVNTKLALAVLWEKMV